MVVQPAQLLAYKAAVLPRTAPDLPPGVRAEIGRLFPDTAGEIDRAWRNRWVHNHEETTADQAKSERRQTLLRQLQAVAVREHRFNRDGDDCIFSG
uniref:RxLR effector candidate protein n=1 Tax=Hyaloperonospora arabidopsidis (strain Emoy2) TaxID=559515 RepID=M4C1Q1_HYAAE